MGLGWRFGLYGNYANLTALKYPSILGLGYTQPAARDPLGFGECVNLYPLHSFNSYSSLVTRGHWQCEYQLHTAHKGWISL